MKNKFYLYLSAIVLFGLILRAPGIFWGYHFLGGTTRTTLHNDEMTWVNITNGFLRKSVNHWYSPSQAFGVAIFAWPLRKFCHFPFISIFYLGRISSLVYGLLTIFLVGVIAKNLSGQNLIGLLAALFLALSDNQATYSHIFIPDASAVFWLYLALYLAYLFWRSNDLKLLVFSAWAAGAALAAKFNNVAIFVLLFVAAIIKKNWFLVFLVLAVLAGSFYLMNGTYYNWAQICAARQNIGVRLETESASKIVSLLILPLTILVSVGAGVFILFLIGLFIFVKKIFAGGFLAYAPILMTFGLGLLIYFGEIFNLGFTGFRFLLPFLPAIAILAALSFKWSPFLKSQKKWLLPLIIFYQLAYFIPAQANFIFEPRQNAGQWLKNNVPSGTTLAVSAHSFVPKAFKTTFSMNQNILVLAEQGYNRYLSKQGLSYKITKQLPTLEEIYNPNLGYGEDPLILQKILTGQTNYQLIKKFDTFTLTPEWALWKSLGYRPSLVGNVLIYQKNEKPRESH